MTVYTHCKVSCHHTQRAKCALCNSHERVGKTQVNVQCFKKINTSLQRHLPKSMNCFMDRGEGENLENLSTCLGIPATEPFFSKNWANFIFPKCHCSSLLSLQFRANVSGANTSQGSASCRKEIIKKKGCWLRVPHHCFSRAVSFHPGQVVECPSSATSSPRARATCWVVVVVGRRDWRKNQPMRDETLLELCVPAEKCGNFIKNIKIFSSFRTLLLLFRSFFW